MLNSAKCKILSSDSWTVRRNSVTCSLTDWRLHRSYCYRSFTEFFFIGNMQNDTYWETVNEAAGFFLLDSQYALSHLHHCCHPVNFFYICSAEHLIAHYIGPDGGCFALDRCDDKNFIIFWRHSASLTLQPSWYAVERSLKNWILSNLTLTTIRKVLPHQSYVRLIAIIKFFRAIPISTVTIR